MHPEQGTHLGFIAQEVQPVLPERVSVGDDANHTLGLTYTEFIPVIVRAIQQLAARISDLANTVGGFAERFVTKELVATNITTDHIQFKTANGDKLCLGYTCVTESQLAAILAATINGENPARIHVGDKYGDLGATITAPEQDKNLGIKTYLNGALVSDIVLDTSAPATDIIDYVATDQNSLTSTSTRTVIVEASEPTPPTPDTSTPTQ